MFNYEEFGEKLFEKVQVSVPEIMDEYPDLYAVSLDLADSLTSIGIIANYKEYLNENVEDEEDEDYMYYKYCEDEWGYFDTFEDISSILSKEIEENSDSYTDKETNHYTDKFAEHFDKLIKICVSVMAQYREILNEDDNEILLTVNARESLDPNARIAIFKSINGEELAKEYEENIEEFC